MTDDERREVEREALWKVGRAMAALSYGVDTDSGSTNVRYLNLGKALAWGFVAAAIARGEAGDAVADALRAEGLPVGGYDD